MLQMTLALRLMKLLLSLEKVWCASLVATAFHLSTKLLVAGQGQQVSLRSVDHRLHQLRHQHKPPYPCSLLQHSPPSHLPQSQHLNQPELSLWEIVCLRTTAAKTLSARSIGPSTASLCGAHAQHHTASGLEPQRQRQPQRQPLHLLRAEEDQLPSQAAVYLKMIAPRTLSAPRTGRHIAEQQRVSVQHHSARRHHPCHKQLQFSGISDLRHMCCSQTLAARSSSNSNSLI